MTVKVRMLQCLSSLRYLPLYYVLHVLHFLEILPHLEIPQPSKSHCIFQPTHLNKCRPQNLATQRHMYVHAHYTCIQTDAVYVRACQSL